MSTETKKANKSSLMEKFKEEHAREVNLLRDQIVTITQERNYLDWLSYLLVNDTLGSADQIHILYLTLP